MNYLSPILLLICCLCFAAWLFRRDRKIEKRRVRDAASAEVCHEIKKEREAALLRREKFRKALEDAKRGPTGSP